VIERAGGTLLMRGKIVAVSRRTTQGFACGIVTLDEFEGESYTIHFQNENLVRRAGEQVLATVPDLIWVLDSESGTAVTTESFDTVLE